MKHGMKNNPKTMKKKLKEWHDQLIQKNKFKEGYFKPHIFPRKLKYQGVSPFIVCKSYPNQVLMQRLMGLIMSMAS